jgi:pimeloyl-ACP methyl ester carboxylesterase
MTAPGELRRPTLVVRGGAGRLTRAEADEMRERRPETVLKTVPGAGHDVHLDRPDALATAIEGFLDAPPGPQLPER